MLSLCTLVKFVIFHPYFFVLKTRLMLPIDLGRIQDFENFYPSYPKMRMLVILFGASSMEGTLLWEWELLISRNLFPRKIF